jgi:hypothetical protein
MNFFWDTNLHYFSLSVKNGLGEYQSAQDYHKIVKFSQNLTFFQGRINSWIYQRQLSGPVDYPVPAKQELAGFVSVVGIYWWYFLDF